MNEPQRVGCSNPPESYAEEWRRQAAGRADAMAGATEEMLDMAGVSEGMRVLDLGAEWEISPSRRACGSARPVPFWRPTATRRCSRGRARRSRRRA